MKTTALTPYLHKLLPDFSRQDLAHKQFARRSGMQHPQPERNKKSTL